MNITVPMIESHGIRMTLDEAGMDWKDNNDGSFDVTVDEQTITLRPLDNHGTVIKIEGNPDPIELR